MEPPFANRDVDWSIGGCNGMLLAVFLDAKDTLFDMEELCLSKVDMPGQSASIYT
jgi:hypothetical protein